MKMLLFCNCMLLALLSAYAQQNMTPKTTAQMVKENFKIRAVVQQGKVVGYNTFFVSQPKCEQPDVTANESTLSLRLQTAPAANSQIKFININFIKDTSVYPPCVYKNTLGYTTKPLFHFAPLTDVLKTKLAKGYVAQSMTI
ncbi:MAG: hypothetical protein ACKVOM_04350 [Ferruginibacter sp.]